MRDRQPSPAQPCLRPALLPAPAGPGYRGGPQRAGESTAVLGLGLKPGEGAEGTSEEGWENEQIAAEGQLTFQKPLAQLERHEPFVDVQGQRCSFLGEQHDGREGNSWPGRRGHPRAARSPSLKGAFEAHSRGMCCPTSPEHCRARRVAHARGCGRSQQGD